MRGLLADVNVEGHLHYLRRIFHRLDLWETLAQAEIELGTFHELNIPDHLDDRSVWNTCQREGWVLFTENRNLDGPNSLEATLSDSWKPGLLPVITLANKTRFEHDPDYSDVVGSDIADLLFDLVSGKPGEIARIYVPRRANV